MKIELRPLSEIKPYPNNPRINDDAVDAVVASLREFGFRQPIVVDADCVIICGHTRYKAAQKLGLEKVPVHVATDLSPEQIKAYRIADNAMALGRKAIQSREKALFTELNGTGNGASFFTAARGNYFEGAGANLQSTSLATAVQMFRDQKGPDGDPIMVEPRLLLVPTALEQVAKELMNSQYILGPTTTKQPSVNVWQGAFTPLTSPWLSNTNLAGASSTAWYLLADPSDVAALEIAYLNGQQTPTVEFFGLDSDPNVLGVTWRVYWDFGVALAEFRGGVKSKGAA